MPDRNGAAAVLARTGRAMASVWDNRDLRRVQLSLVASLVGDGAYATAVTVWAYGEGGATAVGLFTAVRLVAAAVLAPVGAAVADRCSRRATLVACDASRAALVAAAAVCLTLDGPWAVYVLATAAGVFNAPFRSAQRAWLPTLSRTPGELAAANAASSTVESLAVFVGPALGGLLLLLTSVGTVFWLNVATFVVSLVLVLGVRPARTVVTARDGGDGVLGELAAGFRTLGEDRDLRAVTGQVCAQTFVGGAAKVFLVVVAIEVFDTGARGVGLLEAIVGVGAIAGGVLALALSERQRLGRDLITGVVLWSAPLLVLVVWLHPAPVVVALLVLGLANPLVDVNLDTIVQRLTPEHLMARVFGALDTCYIATSALGSLLTPLLLDLVGLRWTLLAIGAPVLLVALAGRPRLAGLDQRLEPPAYAPVLRRIDWFALLAPAVLESVAASAHERRVPARGRVITQGEPGDAFFVVLSGDVEVSHDGRALRRQGPGDYFGEIALLHDVPRTATVTAISDTVLLVVDREPFLRALSGGGLSAAQDVAATRLRFTG